MSEKTLMPKATAIWLIDNTAITFSQIARFTVLHMLEVQNMADGDLGGNIQGMNPVIAGQLTSEEIKRCEADSTASLQANQSLMPLKNYKIKEKQNIHLFLSAKKNQMLFIFFLKNSLF